MRVLTLLALGGCPSREAFDRQYVRSYCEYVWRCDRETFAVLFGDHRGCHEVVFRDHEGVSACLADRCRFDAGGAAACLEALNAGCSAFLDGIQGCDGVWVDCDAGADRCRGEP